MNEEMIQAILAILTSIGIVAIPAYIVFKDDIKKYFAFRKFPIGKRVYLGENFPIGEMVGMGVVVVKQSKWSNRITVSPNTDKKRKKVKKYESQIDKHADLSVDIYKRGEMPETMWGNIEYFTTINPIKSPIIKNKKKGIKMSRAHRFLFNTAWVYLAWKVVLNIEPIIKYIIELF